MISEVAIFVLASFLTLLIFFVSKVVGLSKGRNDLKENQMKVENLNQDDGSPPKFKKRYVGHKPVITIGNGKLDLKALQEEAEAENRLHFRAKKLRNRTIITTLE